MPRLPLSLLVMLLPGSVFAGEISFRNEVMAVLSRGGCNSGACHGNQNGKNGFKLSLRGEDPALDWLSLTRDTQGRRVNVVDPGTSLLLAKAIAELPHEGGRRFSPHSREYQLLSRWILQGAKFDPPGAPLLQALNVTPREQTVLEPASSVQLRVEAAFSDGTRRDIAGLAVYEASSDIASVSGTGLVQKRRLGETTIIVRYLDRQTAVRLAFVSARPGFVWTAPPEANPIDHLVFSRLRELRMNPSPVCPDHIFLRRVYLDTLGILPSADEARRFLKDERPDKRELLIESLLARPEFNDFWALKWSDLLRNDEKALDSKGVQVFHGWIRRAMADNLPLNEFARELLTGRGSTYTAPAANFYRALRDPQVRAETAAQVFLGVRLQCARCHNHPFDQWKQDDYHSLAAFFARVQYRIVDNKRRDKLDLHEFIGEQIVSHDGKDEVKHPRTGQVMTPQFLGGALLGPNEDRLQALAAWVAHPANPFFARTQANRVCYHLLGRGIVEPNDDFRVSNPPANPALLDALARELAESKFDLRRLSRFILQSNVYQLSARPNDTNADDESNFSHAIIRPLQAEQLLDALSHVTGVPAEFSGHPFGIRAGQLPGSRAPASRDRKPTDADLFLAAFGKPVRSLACECERSSDSTLNQALVLIGGPLLDGMLTRKDNRLGRLLLTKKTEDEILDELYLSAVCRFPTRAERQRVQGHLARVKDRRRCFEDVTWALLNSKEFLMRQ